MENKVLIVTTIISAIGLFFMPTIPKHDDSKTEPEYVIQGEKYLDELKLENEKKMLEMKDSLDSISVQKPKVKVVKVFFINSLTW